MKFGLQNYAVIILIKNGYIKFSNKKINSLQICDTAQNYILVGHLNQHNFKISKYCHIQKLVKENNGSNKTCSYVYDFSMYETSFF
jgi:hypothetical protein